jgi:hypothetical protein
MGPFDLLNFGYSRRTEMFEYMIATVITTTSSI